MIGNKIEPFKFWCQKVLPNVYDDSLSYYEYLCKLNEYLNEVIEQINTLTDNMSDYETDLSQQWLDYKTDLTEQWTTYKNYIDNYFDNLNVQTEINNKLDAMASDGTLDALIQPYVNSEIATQVSAWLRENVDPVGSAVTIDKTLTISDSAADAKVVGDAINEINNKINNLSLVPNVANKNINNVVGEVATLTNSLIRATTSRFKIDGQHKFSIKEAYVDDYSFKYVETDDDNVITKRGSSFITEYNLPTVGRYIYIILRKNDDSEIDPSIFYTIVDTNYNFNSTSRFADVLNDNLENLQDEIDAIQSSNEIVSFKGDISNNDNYNDYLNAGIYRATINNTYVNCPFDGINNTLVVFRGDSEEQVSANLTVQVCYSAYNDVANRYKTSNGWSDWEYDFKVKSRNKKLGLYYKNSYASNNLLYQNISDVRISTDKFYCYQESYIKIKESYTDTYCFHIVWWIGDTVYGSLSNQYSSYKLASGRYYIVVLKKLDNSALSINDFYTVFEDNVNLNSAMIYIDETIKQSDRTGIYGIEFNYKSKKSKVNRIFNANGLVNDYYDESTQSFYNNGHNDFDNIYPWSEIKRCNLNMKNGVPKVTFEGENGYATDGTNGNVMVRIPEFYFSRTREGSIERWLISAYPYAGFMKFKETYIGAYQGSESDSGKFSVTGRTPLTSHGLLNGYGEFTGSFFEDYAEYNLVPFDFITRIGLQFLVSIEFASINLGNSHNIGGFEGIPYGWGNMEVVPRCTAYESATNTNTIKVRCYPDIHDWEYYSTNGISENVQHNHAHFCIGDTCAVLQSDEYQKIDPRTITAISYEATGLEAPPYVASITVSGSPFNVTANSTVLCGNPQTTGSTDSVYNTYHTGIANRANTFSDANVASWNNHFRHFIYRGIEDIWGNVYNSICGIGHTLTLLKYTFDETLYNAENMDNWNNVPWDKPNVTDFTEAVTGQPYWINEMGYDPECPTLLLTKTCNGSGSNPNVHDLTGDDKFGDTFKCYNRVVQRASVGGGWDHTFRGGLFMMRTDSGNTDGRPYWLNGCRPVYHTKSKTM